MPKNEAQLTTFYAAAGYTFPTSIPRMYLTPPPRLSSYLKINTKQQLHQPPRLLLALAPHGQQKHHRISARALKRALPLASH